MNFTIRNVLRLAWSATKRDWLFLTGASILVVLITIVANWLTNVATVYTFAWIGFVFGIASFLLSLLMQVGFMNISLLSYDKKPRTLRELFAHFRWIAPFLFTLIVVYGLVFILLPIVFKVLQSQTHPLFTVLSLIGPIGAVYIILRYYFAPILVIDENLRPIAALRRSAAISRGNRLRLLGLGVIAVAILLAVFKFFSIINPNAFTTAFTSEAPTLFLMVFQLTTALFLPFFAMMTVASLRLLQAVPAPVLDESSDSESDTEESKTASEPNDPNNPGNGAYA